jgi:protein-disulfide isomerase
MKDPELDPILSTAARWSIKMLAGFNATKALSPKGRITRFVTLAILGCTTCRELVSQFIPGFGHLVAPRVLVATIVAVPFIVSAFLLRDYRPDDFITPGVRCLTNVRVCAAPASLVSAWILRHRFAVNPVSAGLVVGILSGIAGVMLLTLLAVSVPTVALAQDVKIITPARQKQLLINPGSSSAGSGKPEVTIVEYFDYNCPFCRELAPELKSLIRDDRKVALVYKDWPVFGGVSVYAAREALAAEWQGKYLISHDTLIGGPRLAQEDQVDAELKAAGVDMAALAKDRDTHAAQIDALLRRNDSEARALHIRGTPGIIVDRQVLPGTVDLKGLKLLVDRARHDQSLRGKAQE